MVIIYYDFLSYSKLLIRHNKKDGGMSILPKCIAVIKYKQLKKDDTKQS